MVGKSQDMMSQRDRILGKPFLHVIFVESITQESVGELPKGVMERISQLAIRVARCIPVFGIGLRVGLDI